MEFQRTTVTVNGDVYRLRELSAGAVEVLDAAPEHGDYTQALILLALSLCDEAGAPMYRVAQLDEALDAVRQWPAALVRDHLIPAATAINQGTLDDARGN